MAVQKSKKSRSKSKMRRSQQLIKPFALSTDSVSGIRHIRHHMTKDGFYRGKRILPFKAEGEDATSESGSES